MSIWKEIRCDRNRDDCYDNKGNGPQGFEPATTLRKRGRRNGWKFIDGDDICPSCAKSEPPPVKICTACFRIFTRSMGACPFCVPQ